MTAPTANSAEANEPATSPRSALIGNVGRLQTWLQNFLAGSILLLMLLQALQGVPPRVRKTILPLTRHLGIEQDQWQMFAPDPDRRNHRIWAKVYYMDGTTREWHPPSWREQSRWERFLTHRLSKFCENIYDPGFVAARPATAKWIVEELARDPVNPPKAAAARLEFWSEEGSVPDPMYFPWPSADEPSKFENRWQFDSVLWESIPATAVEQEQP